MNVIELRQKRAKLLTECQDINNKVLREGRPYTNEENERYERLWNEARNLQTQIERTEMLATEEKRLAQPTAPAMKPDPEGNYYNEIRPGEVRLLMPSQSISMGKSYAPLGGIRPEELNIGRWMKGIVTGDWKDAGAELRATMSTGSSTLGGYLVPDVLSDKVIDIARNQATVMRAGAITLALDSPKLTMATVEKDVTAYWKAENQEATESNLEVGALRLDCRTLVGFCKMSMELFMDAPNMGQLVETALSQALALELDRACLRGMGAGNEPMGVRNWPGIQTIDMGVNGGTLTGYDDFSKAYTKLLEKNASGERISVIMAPRTFGDLDKKKDTQGQPLKPPASWEKMGKLVSNQIPINLTKGTATNASEAYVGQFDQLIIGMMSPIRVDVSKEANDSGSSAFKNLQVFVRAFLRADMLLMRPSWFCVLDGIIPD